MNKEIRKIRKLLGNRFHLCVKYDDNVEPSEWHLFRRYGDAKVYFSKDNGEIMSSETNTLEDLMEFAKRHHKIDEHLVVSKLIMYMLWLAFVICVLNVFLWDSNYVRVGVIVTDIIGIFITLSMYFIWNKNWKVDMYDLDENYKENMKRLMKEFNEKMEEHREKTRRHNK